jgi:hypothetical protein
MIFVRHQKAAAGDVSDAPGLPTEWKGDNHRLEALIMTAREPVWNVDA